MTLKVIVTGTGRCGTVYMAIVLTKLQIECGHESIFNVESERTVMDRATGVILPVPSKVSLREGGVPDVKKIVADSSYMAAPYLDREEIVGIPVIHVVRDPLAVISSFVLDLHYFRFLKQNKYNVENWEEWITAQLPEVLAYNHPIERACCFYVRWNEMIEKMCKLYHPYFFHRIEDPLPKRFFYFLGLEPYPAFPVNSKANTMKKRERDIRIGEIPDGKMKDEFLAMRARYKYVNEDQGTEEDSTSYEVANLRRDTLSAEG